MASLVQLSERTSLVEGSSVQQASVLHSDAMLQRARTKPERKTRGVSPCVCLSVCQMDRRAAPEDKNRSSGWKSHSLECESSGHFFIANNIRLD